MLARIGFFATAAAAMAFAVFDLTGSALAAVAAAAVPFVLGVTNFMPFAGWALPVVFVAWALTARTIDPAVDAAVQVPDRTILAATTDSGN